MRLAPRLERILGIAQGNRNLAAFSARASPPNSIYLSGATGAAAVASTHGRCGRRSVPAGSAWLVVGGGLVSVLMRRGKWNELDSGLYNP